MHGNGIGQGNLVKFRVIVGHRAAFIGHGDLSPLRIDGRYPAHIPVKDLLFIVVSHLHDLVMEPQSFPPPGQFIF